jgi:predicted transcriptional regulator
MKVRQNLYIDRELAEALDGLAARRGGNKSRIVNEALRQWLARRASKEIDDLLKVRLDRMSRDIAAGRRDIEVVLEALALFVRYQLTVTAPLPEADTAALAVGNERFERFIAQLGRQLAGGKRSLDGDAGGGGEP